MNNEIKTTFKECVLDNVWFKILSGISILLIIISFFLPPTGAIDPTVMAGVCEIFAWGALWTVVKAIDKGKTISMQHGDTTITVNGKTYKLEENTEENTEEE